jgi:hypothetical protein
MMSKSIWAGTCSAFVGAATIAMMAQTPPPPQQTPPPQTPPTQQSSKASGDRITVTGCLKAAPSSATDTGTAGTSGTAGATGATGTTGTAGAAGAATDPADAKFVLTDVSVSPAPSETAAGSTAGSTASGSETNPAHAAQTYRLVANPASLSPHVGKKLELTGTVVEQPGAPSSASSETASTANAPELRVEAGKVLAASCQP